MASACVEATVAQRDRRAVVRGDVEHERLRRLLGGLLERLELAPRGVEVAERDERRHAPGHRLGADLRVAELLAERIASVSIARISSNELVPRDQKARTSTIARPDRSSSRRAMPTALFRTTAARS